MSWIVVFTSLNVKLFHTCIFICSYLTYKYINCTFRVGAYVNLISLSFTQLTWQWYWYRKHFVVNVVFASSRKQFEEVSKENKELQQARDKINEASIQVSHVFIVVFSPCGPIRTTDMYLDCISVWGTSSSWGFLIHQNGMYMEGSELDSHLEAIKSLFRKSRGLRIWRRRSGSRTCSRSWTIWRPSSRTSLTREPSPFNIFGNNSKERVRIL